VLGLLTKVHGWSAAEAQEVRDLEAWLDGHPTIGELRGRCDQVLAKLI
jgi:hypothetical protein